MKGFCMVKQIKRPLKIGNLVNFNKDFYCHYNDLL